MPVFSVSPLSTIPLAFISEMAEAIFASDMSGLSFLMRALAAALSP